jgi:hypothetical protein
LRAFVAPTALPPCRRAGVAGERELVEHSRVAREIANLAPRYAPPSSPHLEATRDADGIRRGRHSRPSASYADLVALVDFVERFWADDPEALKVITPGEDGITP